MYCFQFNPKMKILFVPSCIITLFVQGLILRIKAVLLFYDSIDLPANRTCFVFSLLDIPPVFGATGSLTNRSINDSLNYASSRDSPQGSGPYGSRRVTTYGSVPTYGSFVPKNSPGGRLAPRGTTPPLLVQPPGSHLYITEEDEQVGGIAER